MATSILITPHFNCLSTGGIDIFFWVWPPCYSSEQSMICRILCIILPVNFVKPTFTNGKAVLILKTHEHSVHIWYLDLLPGYMKLNKQTISAILHATWELLPSLIGWGNAICAVSHCYCLILSFICWNNTVC